MQFGNIWPESVAKDRYSADFNRTADVRYAMPLHVRFPGMNGCMRMGSVSRGSSRPIKIAGVLELRTQMSGASQRVPNLIRSRACADRIPIRAAQAPTIALPVAVFRMISTASAARPQNCLLSAEPGVLTGGTLRSLAASTGGTGRRRLAAAALLAGMCLAATGARAQDAT